MAYRTIQEVKFLSGLVCLPSLGLELLDCRMPIA